MTAAAFHLENTPSKLFSLHSVPVFFKSRLNTHIFNFSMKQLSKACTFRAGCRASLLITARFMIFINSMTQHFGKALHETIQAPQ